MTIRLAVVVTLSSVVLCSCAPASLSSNSNQNNGQTNANLNATVTTNANSNAVLRTNGNTNAPVVRATPKENTNSAVVPVTTKTATYNGQWFDIRYPENFELKPRVDEMDPSATADEMYFASKDNSVEFFVFSPLWRGEPAAYLDAAPGEVLSATKSETSGEGLDKKTITWGTFKAKDNSYLRSYVSIKSQVDTGSDLHHVFGIRYKDQKTYDLYKGAYEAFKQSLVQYADGYAGD